jgi:hypothetical protein
MPRITEFTPSDVQEKLIGHAIDREIGQRLSLDTPPTRVTLLARANMAVPHGRSERPTRKGSNHD